MSKKHGLGLTHIFDNLYETLDFFPLLYRHFLPSTGSALLNKIIHVNQVLIVKPQDVLLTFIHSQSSMQNCNNNQTNT